MRDDWTGEYPLDDDADWLLNKCGPCGFYKDELGCTAHATRRMVCRLLNCDTDSVQSKEEAV
jgi:Fe-S-cluster containining protein